MPTHLSGRKKKKMDLTYLQKAMVWYHMHYAEFLKGKSLF